MTERQRRSARRAGITLSEVLVLALIMAICIALLLPALLTSRERARRRTCEMRLTQLTRSVQAFESAAGSFPSGVLNPTGPIEHTPQGMHHGWLCQVLPFLDEQALFDQIDPAISIYGEHHRAVREAVIEKWKCPAAPLQASASSYAACHNDTEQPIDINNAGVFFLNSQITQDDITDGLKHTLLLGEKTSASDDLGWYSGTRASLRNTGKPPAVHVDVDAHESPQRRVGGFGSWHPGNSHMAMGDGRVTLMSHQIDPTLFRQIGNRTDGDSDPPTTKASP